MSSRHFLTTRSDYRLIVTLGLSIFLHALPFLTDFISQPQQPSTVAPLSATLRPPPPPPPEQVPLTLPEPPKPATAAEKPAPKPPAKPAAKPPAKQAKTWTQAVRQHLQKLDSAGQFYPAEAIARNLQGEVLVLLIIDPAGNVSAARVEQSSGHPLLDEAALRAVRSLRALPADAPRETLLPVRFRLR